MSEVRARFFLITMPGLTKSERERNAIALRGQIVGLFRSGKIIKEICDIVGLDRKTVRKWICR